MRPIASAFALALVIGLGIFNVIHALALQEQARIQRDIYAWIERSVYEPAGRKVVVLAPQFAAIWIHMPWMRQLGTQVFEWRRPRLDLSDDVLILHDRTGVEPWLRERMPERRFYRIELLPGGPRTRSSGRSHAGSPIPWCAAPRRAAAHAGAFGDPERGIAVSSLTPRTRTWLLALGGALCLAEIWIAGLYYNGYQILNGRHGWFPSEMAFLLYYVLFGIPAAILLTAALAPSAGSPSARGLRPRGEHCRVGDVDGRGRLRLRAHLPARHPGAIRAPEGCRRQ